MPNNAANVAVQVLEDLPSIFAFVRGFFAGSGGQLPTYAQLVAERDALVAAGIAQGDAELKAKGASV